MKLVGLAVVALTLSSCQSAILMAVPEPLPEALPWSSVQESGGFLGLQTRENDSGSLEDLFFSPGVRVVRVIENSPAAAIGIEPSDILLRFDGEEVNDPSALDALVAAKAGGDLVKLEVSRDDTVFELTVELAAAGADNLIQPEVLYRVDLARSSAGWATDVGGVRLVSANEESPVIEAGLSIGCVVTKVNGETIFSDRELIRELARYEEGSDVTFAFRTPAGEAKEAEVELLEAPSYTASFSIPIVLSYAHDPDRLTTDFAFIDLWILSLFEYHREGNEKTWSLLRFIEFSSGVGELVDG